MTFTTKLMRGVFLALAVLAAPMAGAPILGVGAAYAQQETLIASVLFEGNARFSDAQLLAMVDVAERGTFNQGRLDADVESIRLAYEQQGYVGVRVTARTEIADNGRTRITFVVNEGDRTGIAAINFTGNNAFNSGTLKSTIKTRETHILSWLFRDDAYDPAKIEVDKELVRLYYANHGYPDAYVSSAVAEFDSERNGYFINFTVVEGERYEYGTIDVETSIPGLNADVLRSSVDTHPGQRYTYSELARTQEDMAFEATAQGYAFADVRPRISRDIANRTFNITYLVDEGPRIYIDRINITGNTKTRDFVIRRELGFAEGDPYNRSMVQRAKTSVQALGYFKTVDISLEPGSAQDKVILNVHVEESSTGDYGATVGYSSTEGILGEVSITERNFLGRGQYLRGAITASGTGRGIEISFTEPRFMGLKISSGIDFYHRIQDETGSVYYGTTATGGQVRFGAPITWDVTLTTFLGGEQKTIAEKINPVSAIPGITDGAVFNKLWVGYGIGYNSLDDQKNPTEGIIGSFTQQYVGLSHNFIKTEAKARWFIPLMEDAGIIGSVRGQAGIINALNGTTVHSTEAFHLGPTLVRGFEARSFGPRLTPGPTGEMIGATMYAGISAEVEFPLPVLPESYGIKGAVWADAGWVNGVAQGLVATASSVNQPLKSSVGASVIWDSPFGPIRGDFAYVLTQATDDKTQVFQLTIQNLL